MSHSMDRRGALRLASGLAAAAQPAAVHASGRQASAFEALPIPHASMFARTRYFEINSLKAQARYGIWVTVPTAYEQNPQQRFPAIFAPDGNQFVMFSPSTSDAGMVDPINPVQSTIQVCVGYTGREIKQSLAVRARDLLPPKEALPEGMIAAMKASPPNPLIDKATNDLYIRNLENPAGDRFLAFITEELHPFILENFRVQPDATGLFGYSFGGLFAAYAALQKFTVFRNFGAGSPGIMTARSMIFQLYADALGAGGLSPRNLHMSVGEKEITAQSSYQLLVGRSAVDFIAKAGNTPIKGVRFSSHLVPHESHSSGALPAFYSFLRELYPAKT